MSEKMKTERIDTDVLIIGGGTAGCYAALTIAEQSPGTRVVIAEKANIIRSGCLAAGVNALNAYINPGQTVQDYVDYAVHDAAGIAREDLLHTMSEGLNEVTAKLEQLGLVILTAPMWRAGREISRSTGRTSSRCWLRQSCVRKMSRYTIT